ncbi:hypothetical protein AMES_6035 [Amycolatopsis mediterranei S699]|uniref:Secreted protein n=2 Tax=Amycolatopsis mediterranei TaxID=33910 RepID=A0A0H3DA30_AMYMU|nr:hypothetical protein AMED_6123 [Amycolatopsis mediterranei U32]AFO79571.1 hypothetical protein AMES_6035 [Amycolatopsis mediterranei S699]AGT86699.1 hypothetical protein B737_6035 [Amycolatopsis mediterranei RB]KDO10335.1 hypothetical protein DV26_13120 [Amycolatopsis mediterranei]KDU85335.1 hypothetical protein DV36_46900 [Amycolatopsis mediterranei]
MRMTKISSAAAVLLCAGGLAVAVPEAAAAPHAPVARVGSPPAQCLSGVRRVQVTYRHTPARRHIPARRLYVVRSVWIPFITSGGVLCLKS